jgi:glycogen debranching enzyme
MAHYLDIFNDNPLVKENLFKTTSPNATRPPSFESCRNKLPSPFWNSIEYGASAIELYWYVWRIAFSNLHPVIPESKFVSPFIDSAFNESIFMWDTVFMMKFTKYGEHAFHFMGTLDNFYVHQLQDGFISREISRFDGSPKFHRHDPSSTGPNVLAWAELEHFRLTQDLNRLKKVFPCILAYHQWNARYRTWPDNSYWGCGLSSGIDYQPRNVTPGSNGLIDHSHMAWIDATCQALISARCLIQMAQYIGGDVASSQSVLELQHEVDFLTEYVNANMYNEELGTYMDRPLKLDYKTKLPLDFSTTRSIASYWALLAGVVPESRIDRFVSFLDDICFFNRPVRVPSLSADNMEYRSDGGYWLGGVWPSTTYMVLSGLTETGFDDIAADIGFNYFHNVLKVFNHTGTVWENLAPEYPMPGNPSKPNFVGWAGIVNAVLFEYVFGIRTLVEPRAILIDVRLLDKYGILKYPFGDKTIDITVEARNSISDEPQVTISSEEDVCVIYQWGKSMSFVGGVDVDRMGIPRGPINERRIVIKGSKQ